MSKVLEVNYEKCTGCRTCELACSVYHAGVSNPARSRIRIIKWEWEGRYVPMSCQQCQDAPCKAICPVKAISRDEELNRVIVDYDSCIGCRMCIAACPFGAMKFDILDNTVIKCDLCDGEPQCVRFCETKAIDYIEVENQSIDKQISVADKLTSITQKVSAAMAE